MKKGLGFTLIEIVLAIAISTVFLTSIFMTYKKADMNKRLTEELRNTQGVMNEIESIYTGFYNIPGRTNGQHLQVFRSLNKGGKLVFYFDSSNSIYYKNSLGGQTYITYYGGGYNGNHSLNHCLRITSKEYPLDRISKAYETTGYYVKEFRSKSGFMEGLWICF
ncbi:type II secretion system GspH family protein [Klebsiella pneumoniae]|uniref:type II secretion system protein n=1 Tax=Enterobacteriaceae TaxID=543 RepID=UPI000FA62636|nr:prepilin-type N-terminal cleavage/methylation domain-containing protein [Escherichia coli]EFL4050012.1 type II secretion system protein [Escherichia coli]EFL9479272.1 type II secretion system protein [Escherichia coli]EFN4220147.1 type II secretion system protein [Escherichia coli]EFN4267736.1 type II secretion system protein [Escherichia coli]EFU9203024.1 type II secretion system protein [Escherichia coli]